MIITEHVTIFLWMFIDTYDTICKKPKKRERAIFRKGKKEFWEAARTGICSRRIGAYFPLF